MVLILGTSSGVYATLKPNTDNRLVTLFGLNYWAAAGLGTPIESYDFPSFTLTTSDGTQYVLQRQDLGEHFTLSNDGTSSFVHAYGQGKLTRILEVSGDRIEFSSTTVQAFNANGELTKGILFHRDGQGRIDALYDPIHLNNGVPTGPAAVTYEYDVAGNLVKVKKLTDESNPGSPLYSTIEYVYGDSRFPHYITAIKDPSGHTPRKSFYDDNGHLSYTEDAFGNRTTLVHNLVARTETVYDRMPIPNQTTYFYDTLGNVLQQIQYLDGQQVVTSFTYTDSANPNKETSITDPLGHTTTMTYDANGNMLTVTTPHAQNEADADFTTTMTYDNFGNLLTTKDAQGHKTSNVYDSHGNLLATTDAMGNTNTFTYDSAGNLIATTDALNRVTSRFAYDSSGNLTSTTDSAGVSWSFSYDSNGNQTGTSFLWTNPLNPQDQRSITSQTIYNAAGQVTSTVDALGHTSSTIYMLETELMSYAMTDFWSNDFPELTAFWSYFRRDFVITAIEMDVKMGIVLL